MKNILLVVLIFAGCSFNARSSADIEKVVLPRPSARGEVSVEQAIGERRSVRSFLPDELKIEHKGQLLWAAQGITEQQRGLRAAPSAGATYPLEIYLVNKDGVYSYNPSEHELVLLKKGDLRGALSRAALGQGFISRAPVSIVITAVYARTERRYGGRARRYVHIEAGHAAQNIHLQAVSLGLGSVPVGAFNDEELRKVLSLPQDREPVYIIPVGYPG